VYHNWMRTLSSSPCQLRLGVVLRRSSLSPYSQLDSELVEGSSWAGGPNENLVYYYQFFYNFSTS